MALYSKELDIPIYLQWNKVHDNKTRDKKGKIIVFVIVFNPFKYTTSASKNKQNIWIDTEYNESMTPYLNGYRLTPFNGPIQMSIYYRAVQFIPEISHSHIPK